MDKPVTILGAGGIGKLALDIFTANGVEVYCFLDDDEELHQTEIDQVGILGGTENEELLAQIGSSSEAFVAADEMAYKKSLVKMLNEQREVMPVNAVHPKACIAASARIGHGNLIGPNAVVNTHADIGHHCIVHSNAVVDYEAQLGDYVHVGAGSIIGGRVQVQEGAFIGSGVTIVPGVTIGKNASVGAGSVVVKHVEEGQTVFGNPAEAL